MDRDGYEKIRSALEGAPCPVVLRPVPREGENIRELTIRIGQVLRPDFIDKSLRDAGLLAPPDSPAPETDRSIPALRVMNITDTVIEFEDLNAGPFIDLTAAENKEASLADASLVDA